MTDLFGFTYYYGNGDYYSGIGIADIGAYSTGQYIGYADGNINETGYDGFYYISAVYNGGSSDPAGSVFVESYYDGDTGYGSAALVSASGSAGLGSEYGYVYNSDYSRYNDFGNGYYEADLNVSTDLYYFTYNYGNGDSYSGYGYAATGTYSTNQYIGYADGLNSQTGYDDYYFISAVYGGQTGTTDSVSVYAYYDGDTGYGVASSISGSGFSGLGSEQGYAYNSDFSNTSSLFGYYGYYEADLINI